jgi:hypothetical protein
MTTLDSVTYGGPGPASDSLQAAYFRSVLAEERAQIESELIGQTRILSSLPPTIPSTVISRVRRRIRAKQAEHRELDRMIEAIDQRFATSWAMELEALQRGQQIPADPDVVLLRSLARGRVGDHRVTAISSDSFIAIGPAGA